MPGKGQASYLKIRQCCEPAFSVAWLPLRTIQAVASTHLVPLQRRSQDGVLVRSGISDDGPEVAQPCRFEWINMPALELKLVLGTKPKVWLMQRVAGSAQAGAAVGSSGGGVGLAQHQVDEKCCSPALAISPSVVQL